MYFVLNLREAVQQRNWYKRIEDWVRHAATSGGPARGIICTAWLKVAFTQIGQSTDTVHLKEQSGYVQGRLRPLLAWTAFASAFTISKKRSTKKNLGTASLRALTRILSRTRESVSHAWQRGATEQPRCGGFQIQTGTRECVGLLEYDTHICRGALNSLVGADFKFKLALGNAEQSVLKVCSHSKALLIRLGPAVATPALAKSKN